MAGTNQFLAKTADPDRALVRAARSGKYEAFEKLVSKYEQSVYTVAMGILRNRQDAQDVVQETFLSILEHLADFQEASTFRTWLMRIATNHALKILRKRRGLKTVPLDIPQEEQEQALPHPDFIAVWKDEPQNIVHRRETRRILAKALNELDYKYRAVFILRDVEGLSTEETAQALGIGISNVKIRLLRARLMLRERLTRLFGDQDRRLVADHSHEDLT